MPAFIGTSVLPVRIIVFALVAIVLSGFEPETIGNASGPASSAAAPAVLEGVSFHKSSIRPGTVVRLRFSSRVENFSLERISSNTGVRLTVRPARAGSRRACGSAPSVFTACRIDESGSRLVVEISVSETLLASDVYRDGDQRNHLLMYLHASSEQPATVESSAVESTSEPGVESNVDSSADSTVDSTVAPGESTVVGSPSAVDPGAGTQPPVRPASNPDTQRLRIDTIVLDAGHGGKDPGTVGYNRLREKDVVLDLSKRVGALLEAAGFRVAYTRDDDTFIVLKDRGRLAREAGGKLFVSIHANSVRNPRAYGTETFFLGTHKTDAAREVIERENQVIDLEDDKTHYEQFNSIQLARLRLTQSANLRQSQDLAGLVQEQYRDGASRRDRRVKEGNLYVLWSAGMPAILTEVGFISNPDEARYLTSERGKNEIASAIFRAIRDYRDAFEASLDLVARQ